MGLSLTTTFDAGFDYEEGYLFYYDEEEVVLLEVVTCLPRAFIDGSGYLLLLTTYFALCCITLVVYF